ncbi:MAG: hypothetical protein EOO61_12540 [Hymenobacter sp.]|nr:MAG: hypothetical protein EOO61_12540 [Hymenobacter sp.]
MFYYCYLLVYPQLLRTGRLVQLVLALGLGVLLLTRVRTVLEEGCYPPLLGFQNYTPDTSWATYLFDGLFYTVPTVVVSMAL